jgi:hypothetical protein
MKENTMKAVSRSKKDRKQERKGRAKVLPERNGQGASPQQDAQGVPGRLTISPETIERLIAEAQYQQHPYGKVWQRFDLDALAELAGNIDRRGLDQEILLYQGMILEGWHRYLACLATKTTPKFAEFTGSDLEAAERVHASGIRRQSTPEQRYASFVLLCEACPAFKEKYEELKEKGIQQQQAGKPLSIGGQRVDVVGAKAAAVGVSRSTAAKVEQVKKEKPEAVADIASGTTSANKVLKKTRKAKSPDQPGSADAPKTPPDAGEAAQPLLAELNVIIGRLQKFPSLMESADWSNEDEVKWDKAGEALNAAVPLIGTKAQEAFKNAKGRELSGKEVTIKKLKSLYGKHAVDVLHSSLEELDREEGAMRTYKVVKPLPTQDEFKELQRKRYTSTVADLVDSAFGTLEDLAGEVGDWYDNLPEGFQSGDKGSALDDARNTLESLSQPDVNEQLGTLEVYYEPVQESSSRASRRDDAVARLQAVVDVLAASEDPDAKALSDELENTIDEAEGVEFPGMY